MSSQKTELKYIGSFQIIYLQSTLDICFGTITMTPSWLKYICVILHVYELSRRILWKIYFEKQYCFSSSWRIGATVAVTAAEQATPAPVTQEVAATAAPVAEPATHQVVPTIQVTPAAKDTTPVQQQLKM